jgi:hypothetical protein
MALVPGIRFRDQTLVKPLLAHAGLAAGNEQDGNALRIEREGDAPFVVHRLEPQLLHVGVVGAIQRIDMRAAGGRTEQLDKFRFGIELFLHLKRQLVELRFELFVKGDRPLHLLCSQAHMISSALLTSLPAIPTPLRDVGLRW